MLMFSLFFLSVDLWLCAVCQL